MKNAVRFTEDLQKLNDFLENFSFPINIRESLIIIGGNVMYPYSFIHIINIPCDCHKDKPITDGVFLNYYSVLDKICLYKKVG